MSTKPAADPTLTPSHPGTGMGTAPHIAVSYSSETMEVMGGPGSSTSTLLGRIMLGTTRLAGILAWIGVSTVGVWWVLHRFVAQPWWVRTYSPRTPIEADLMPADMFAAFIWVPLVMLILPLLAMWLRTKWVHAWRYPIRRFLRMRPPPPPISGFGTTPTDALTLSPGWGGGRGTVWYGTIQGILSPEGRVAQGDAGVLIIGPPRSGKTTGVIIPTVLGFDGPVVTASTKPDVLTAVGAYRQKQGRLWLFDPTGTTPTPPGVTTARWSPLVSVTDWDTARDVAAQMVKAEDRSQNTHSDAGDFFRGRATDLISVGLYQAHSDRTGFATVIDTLSWPQTTWAETAGLLEERIADGGSQGDYLASQAAKRLAGMAAREYSGTIGTASNTLAAYQRTTGLDTTTDPNFDPEAFVTSGDTLFIVADGAHMAEVAPIVVALVDTITRTRYRHHTTDPSARRLLLALDEIANLCPLPSITSMWSEAGGQGVTLLAAVQDMTQVKQRWGPDHGWLSLATQKYLLPGIADHDTLRSLSELQGEYEHHRTTQSRGRGWGATDSESDLYTWRPNIPIDTYTRIPVGTGRLIVGAIDQGLITLTPAYNHPLWAAHTGPPAIRQPAHNAMTAAPAGSFAAIAERSMRQ